MLYTRRGGATVLATWLVCVATATADQRIEFNIFNHDCLGAQAPEDIAVDDYGRIYLHHRGIVERFNYNGRPADFLRGQNMDDPPLASVTAVAIDPSGAGYVALNEGQLYRFPPSSRRVALFGQLPSNALDLTVDAGGTIHAVVEQPAQIVRIGSAGNIIATFNLPPGPSGPAEVGEIDVDSGRNLYGADKANRRVIVLDPDGHFSSFSDPVELPTIVGIAVRATPIAEELLVGVDDISGLRVARFTPSGTFLGRIPIDDGPNGPNGIIDIDVDSYGSIYILTARGSQGAIHGIDPDILPENLVDAARRVALPGLPLHGSEDGEYFKGLAVRAGRTAGNFVAVTEARRQLDVLRDQAQYTEFVQEDPELAERISRSLTEINDFLAAVESYSPLVVGELCEPTMAHEPSDPMDDMQEAVGQSLGSEPFYGRYRSSTPIALPLPPRIEMTLDTSTATASFIKPGAWGGDSAVDGGLVRPQVISSNIAIEIGPVVATVSEFSSEFGSIDINGTPSGINHAVLAPNGQVFSTFSAGFPLEFEAHAEGIITNDLYPASRPIFTFADLEGYQGRDGSSAAVYGTNEPMIVPGPPGGPPTELPGIAFIATRVSFDPANGQLQFRENTNPSDAPDVSVILTPDGVFAGGVGAGEPVAGAAFVLDPLVFTGFNLETGRFEFSDASFRIAAGETTLASGQLTDIGIDPQQFLFTASLALDDLPPGVESPFLDALAANLPQILLLTPDATAHLLRGSDSFNSAFQSNTHLMVIAAVVPEPSATILLALGSAFVFFIRARL